MSKSVGTIIDFDMAESGTWFDFFTSRVKDDGSIEYDKPLPGAGRMCIRSSASFIEDQVQKRERCHEMVVNPKTRQMERISYHKELTPEEIKRSNADLWDHVIMDYNAFFDKNGKPIPVTRENKIKLMNIPVFDRFVGKCLKDLNDQTVRHAEELSKNLPE